MTTLVRFDPLREVAAMHTELSRLMNGLFEAPVNGRQTQSWVPTLDVWEEEDALVYAFDLPGIPKDKIDPVFRAAIDEARRRTLVHLRLPANETFKLEYVTGKAWGGYNWYQGNATSLIQINTDLPIHPWRAVDLAAKVDRKWWEKV